MCFSRYRLGHRVVEKDMALMRRQKADEDALLCLDFSTNYRDNGDYDISQAVLATYAESGRKEGGGRGGAVEKDSIALGHEPSRWRLG